MDLAVLHELKNKIRVRQLSSVGYSHPLFQRVLYPTQVKYGRMKYKSEYATPNELKGYYKDKEKEQNGC